MVPVKTVASIIAIDVKAIVLLHVTKLWLGVSKGMILVETFGSVTPVAM